MNETGLIILFVIVLAVTAGLVWWAVQRSSPSQKLPGSVSEPQSSVKSVLQTMFGALPTARLLCIEGPDQGKELEIRGRQIRIGRSRECEIYIDDPLVSWTHALLGYDPRTQQYVLYDQDSTNGTWVNNQRIAQRPIVLGKDQIRVGPAVFIVRQADQPLPTPTPLPLQTIAPTSVERVYPIKDYEILETLGHGGSSVIYKARSHRDKQIVAIKILTQSDPYLLSKFKSEGEIIPKMLRHLHILQVYGLGEIPQTRQPYLVMEYIQGKTLRDRLRAGEPLSVDFAVMITGQVCDALQYAHRKGVYHRDLKPENIFFVRQDYVKLGDFGIARLAQSVTRTSSGYLLGTPLYMSYEQARGMSNIDGRSDLYALGVVLYEMVTGYSPFRADTPLATVDKHLKEVPPSPRQIAPHVPVHVDEAIMRALAKEREYRFRTAEEMALAIGYTSPMHGEEAKSFLGTPSRPQGRQSVRVLQLMRADQSVLSLTPQGMQLGRATLDPRDENISRRHAAIIYRDGIYWLEDAGSTNGTFVNGQRIFSPHALRDGDRIQLGGTILQVIER